MPLAQVAKIEMRTGSASSTASRVSTSCARRARSPAATADVGAILPADPTDGIGSPPDDYDHEQLVYRGVVANGVTRKQGGSERIGPSGTRGDLSSLFAAEILDPDTGWRGSPAREMTPE